MRIAIILLAALSLMANHDAAASQCSRNEAIAAEAITGYLDSWANVYRFFKQYRHCYDASIAEGAEDAIQKLWADNWMKLPEMISLTNKDADFKTFIWQRISDETFPKDRFRHVLFHARKECPTVADEFCQAVMAEGARAR